MRLIAGVEAGDGGRVGQVLVRFGVEDRERLHAAGADELDRGAEHGGHHVDGPALQRRQRRAVAVIGHLDDIEAALDRFDHRGDDRWQTAGAGRAEAHSAGIGLDMLHHPRVIVEGRIRAGNQNGGATGQDVDRDEVRIVLLAKAQNLVEQRVLGAHQQRIAVCLGTRDLVQRNRADAAGDVLQHDLAAENLFGMGRDRTHHRVGRAAGTPLNDALDFLFRIFRHGCRDTECKRAERAEYHSLHESPPFRYGPPGFRQRCVSA